MAAKVNLEEQFGRFDDYWSPKIVAGVHSYDVKVVKVGPGVYCSARIQNDRDGWQPQATLNRSPVFSVGCFPSPSCPSPWPWPPSSPRRRKVSRYSRMAAPRYTRVSV